jgi:hypothetical protein
MTHPGSLMRAQISHGKLNEGLWYTIMSEVEYPTRYTLIIKG